MLWFVAGFIFFLLEFALPGLVIFFFAIGAWVVAIICAFTNISINAQLIIFLLSSLVSLVLFRKGIRKIMSTKKQDSEIEHELIGKTARAETFIGPEQEGKVELNGTLWNARSNESIRKGESVTIIGNESILLIVKSTKKS